jgi:hypothetical protein
LEDWEWFITLTFRPLDQVSSTATKRGWRYANGAWLRFMRFLTPPLGEVRWVRAFELQKERTEPHIHGLVTGTNIALWKEPATWLWAHYGFNRFLRYQRELGAAHYISKYVAKDLGDFAFSDNLRRKSL